VGPGSQPGEVGVYSDGGRLVVLIDVEELVKNRLDLKRRARRRVPTAVHRGGERPPRTDRDRLMALETAPDDQAAIDGILREAHTMKGAAGMVA